MEVRDEARRLYEQYGLGLSEIAKRLSLKHETLKSWKRRDKWSAAHKRESAPTAPGAGAPDVAGVDIPLTDAQEEFCQVFIRSFNATAAYRASHPECTHRAAWTNSYRMMQNEHLRARIEQLKAEKARSLMINQDDVVELFMRIAFADLGQYADWQGGSVRLLGSDGVDGQLVKKVAETKEGVSIELVDKQKALDFLASYFLMHPMDRHKVDFDNRKISLEEQRLNGDTSLLADAGRQTIAIADLINTPAVERHLEDYMPSGGASDDSIRAADDEAD